MSGATVTTIVEIAARPSLVRSLFLDFPNLPNWHKGHFSSITVVESKTGEQTGANLATDDVIRVNLGGMAFKATVAENTPQRFVWRGGWNYVMVGEHSFVFEDSTEHPGGTRLVHGETFTGGLVTLVKPFMGKKHETSPGFERFNADLKKYAEEKAKDGGQA